MTNFKEYNDSELNNKIKESSQLIFEQIGSGHNEKIYHKALKYELDCLNINCDIERHVNVIYRDSKGKNHVLESERIDMYLFGENYDIIIELKAISGSLTERETEQVKKYFRELKKESNRQIKYGIIINFPQPTSKDIRTEIEYKEIMNS